MLSSCSNLQIHIYQHYQSNSNFQGKFSDLGYFKSSEEKGFALLLWTRDLVLVFKMVEINHVAYKMKILEEYNKNMTRIIFKV